MQGHLMQKSRTLVDKKRTKKIKYNKKVGESEKKSDKAHHLVSALVSTLVRSCLTLVKHLLSQLTPQLTPDFLKKLFTPPCFNIFPLILSERSSLLVLGEARKTRADVQPGFIAAVTQSGLGSDSLSAAAL